MRKLLKTITFFTMFLSAVIQAEDRGVEVRPAGKELIETGPKEIITTVFRVTNRSQFKQEFVSELILPEGWRPVTMEFPFELDSLNSGYETDIRLVSFFVPQSTEPGIYQVTYRVSGRQYPSVSDYYSILVSVLSVRGLKASLVETPQHVIAGDFYKLSFVVKNESNIADSVGIELFSDCQYPAVTSEEIFQMGPGMSRTISVTVKTDEKLKRQIKHKVSFTASFLGSQETRAEVTSHVRVIPRIMGVENRYHRIPVNLTIRQIFHKDIEAHKGIQVDIVGEGTFDEAGNKHVRFQLRGPDIYDTSILSDRDRYFFSTWADWFAFHLGDRAYTLSSLTEYSRYGRGIEGKIRLGRFSLGTYYQQARWLGPEREQTGSYFSYFFQKKNRIAVNYLSKKEKKGRSSIASLEGKFELIGRTQVEVEYAVGELNGENHSAYRLKITGLYPKAYCYLDLIRADPDFPGYYYDTQFLSFNTSIYLKNNLRLNGSLRYDKQNFDVDTTRYSAPYTRHYQAGLYYLLKIGTSFSFDYITRSREDRLPCPRFDYDEYTIKIGLGQSGKSYSLRTSAELGKTRNHLIGETFLSKKFSASTFFRPWRGQQIKAYVAYSENARYSGENQRRITTGLNTSLQITNKTVFTLDFQNYYSLEELYQDRNLFEVQLKQFIFNSHQIKLRGRHTILRNSLYKKDTAVLFEYQVALGVPVARRKNIGIIKGKVTNVETGMPVKNAIIRINGTTAVTDNYGTYIFPSIKPGKYFLTLDRAEIGLNMVTVQKVPLPVEVDGGDELQFDLYVTRSSSLSGNVVVYKRSDSSGSDWISGNRGEIEKIYDDINNSTKNVQSKMDSISIDVNKENFTRVDGLAGVLVEINRDDERHRRVTDEEGNFSFEELRPGLWTFKVFDDNLPEHHILDSATGVVDLKPGEKCDIEIRVLPKKRRIRFLQEGGTLIEQKRN